MNDELLDLIDENDIIVGTVLRSYAHKHVLAVRAVNAFIKNSKGQLWIPRRTATKNIYPLALDYSVSGCVQSGESYEQGFERELKEELNLKLSDITARCVGYFTPKTNNVSFFMKVYEIASDDEPPYNREEFCEYFWLYPKELYTIIKQGEQAKSTLPKIIELLYF